MARTAKTATEAGASDPAAGADRQKAEARMNAGVQMLQKVGEVALAGALLGGKAAIAGLRGTMPILELYSGTTRRLEQDGEGGGLEKVGLSRGEAGVVRKAFTKGMLEAIEISSVTHPVYDGAPVYRAYNADGVMEPPQMVHFLALGAAAAAIWRRWEASEEPPEAEPDPIVVIPASQTVAFIAKQPGEYEFITAPQTSADIRRYAMRQRGLNPPRFAMLAYSGDPGSIVPVETRARSATVPLSSTSALSKSSRLRSEAGASRLQSASAPARRSDCGCGGKSKGRCDCGGGHSSCGCGGHSSCGCGGGHSSCGCGGHDTRSFPPARYDEDGSCASLFSISCETRWRIRDCLKVSFCDFLRCMGDELCEREEGKDLDLGKCLEDFLCSFLHCLPDAICPPPEPCEPCCPPHALESCHCNFAVGE
jgi:hypothetical protein